MQLYISVLAYLTVKIRHITRGYLGHKITEGREDVKDIAKQSKKLNATGSVMIRKYLNFALIRLNSNPFESMV